LHDVYSKTKTSDLPVLVIYSTDTNYLLNDYSIYKNFLSRIAPLSKPCTLKIFKKLVIKTAMILSRRNENHPDLCLVA
jgi:hypothetical protein